MMKELKHVIDKSGIYYLVDEKMNIYLSIKIDDEYPGQIIVSTNDAVFQGPVELLKIE